MDATQRKANLLDCYFLQVVADTAPIGWSGRERNWELRKLNYAARDFHKAPGIVTPRAINLIESWPEPEAAHELLVKLEDRLNSAFDLPSYDMIRYFDAENGMLVMYEVERYTWWKTPIESQSTYRIELALEHECIYAHETSTDQHAIWRVDHA